MAHLERRNTVYLDQIFHSSRDRIIKLQFSQGVLKKINEIGNVKYVVVRDK